MASLVLCSICVGFGLSSRTDANFEQHKKKICLDFGLGSENATYPEVMWPVESVLFVLPKLFYCFSIAGQVITKNNIRAEKKMNFQKIEMDSKNPSWPEFSKLFLRFIQYVGVSRCLYFHEISVRLPHLNMEAEMMLATEGPHPTSMIQLPFPVSEFPVFSGSSSGTTQANMRWRNSVHSIRTTEHQLSKYPLA